MLSQYRKEADAQGLHMMSQCYITLNKEEIEI